MLVDLTIKPDDPPILKEQMIEILAMSRVRRALVNPEYLRKIKAGYPDGRSKREIYQERVAAEVRRGLGHG